MTQSRAASAENCVLCQPSQAGWADYFALMKPRVMTLVVFTALVGLVLAPQPIHPLLGLLAILCIAVGGGAAGALNMWYEAESDALMQRTKSRPIPSGLIKKEEALVFALSLAAFSILIMGLFINWFAAGFLAFTIFFYAVVYTIWLKPATPQNIVIGGAAGAFPPMIGWASVTSDISLESLLLFLIIFVWTPPHFWALSLFTSSDYQAAHIPMMPNVRGVQSTKNQISIYAVLMAFIVILPYGLGMASFFYGLMAAGLGMIFIFYARALRRAREHEATVHYAKRLFFFSLVYLTAIFSLLLCEALVLRLFKLI